MDVLENSAMEENITLNGELSIYLFSQHIRVSVLKYNARLTAFNNRRYTSSIRCDDAFAYCCNF